MDRRSQEDNATSKLMRIRRLNMKVILIKITWTLLIQLRIRGLRIESYKNETCNYRLDNTSNQLEGNMTFGSENAVAQL